MKSIALTALLGMAAAFEHAPLFLAQYESESESASDDDVMNVQLEKDYPPTYLLPGQNGTLGASAYERVYPERFQADTDDIFMRSMYETYALEETTPKTDTDPGGVPTGKFWLNKMAAYAVAQEVLATHKGLTGAKLQSYLDTYFEKAWGHFDVNRTGMIEVIKAP